MLFETSPSTGLSNSTDHLLMTCIYIYTMAIATCYTQLANNMASYLAMEYTNKVTTRLILSVHIHFYASTTTLQ